MTGCYESRVAWQEGECTALWLLRVAVMSRGGYSFSGRVMSDLLSWLVIDDWLMPAYSAKWSSERSIKVFQVDISFIWIVGYDYTEKIPKLPKKLHPVHPK